jgi:antitoxin (DNA-binding transcriptional repressor) of toxin-antitoxin stability system
MIKVNIHEAKTHLSRYLRYVMAGDIVVLCMRNVAVAEIHPVDAPRAEPRPVGLAKGSFLVPPTFFDPLPEEELAAFEATGP